MRQQRQSQVTDLFRKLNLADVSFISTDLHQNNQFDYNNKIHPQTSYKIQLFGPIRHIRQYQEQPGASVVPAVLGYDFLRMNKATYQLKIDKITFPKHLSQQDMKRITLNVRLYQYSNI